MHRLRGRARLGCRRCATSRAGWSRARSRRSSGAGARARDRLSRRLRRRRLPLRDHFRLGRARSDRARGWRASLAADSAARETGSAVALEPAQVRAAARGDGARAAAGVPGRSRSRARPSAGFARWSVPGRGGFKGTPARRAFDSPIAIACLVERAPCLPWRTCSISSSHELARRGRRALSRAQLLLCLLDGSLLSAYANLRFAAPPASSAPGADADADADRARHAGAAEAAVAVGVLRQVLLVIVLGVKELGRGGRSRS